MWTQITELEADLTAKVCVEFGFAGPDGFLNSFEIAEGCRGLDMSLAVKAARKTFRMMRMC